ncbi:MAG: sigma-54 dependent transcriptional regulator [Planctomycetota bacterium]
MARVLIADPDLQTADTIARIAEEEGHQVVQVERAEELLDRLGPDLDLVFVADHLPGLPGVEATRTILGRPDAPRVLVTAAFGTVEDAVTAMQAGATDFLCQPLTPSQIRVAIQRALQHGSLLRENKDLKQALDDRLRLDNVISSDPRMQQVFKTVDAVAPTRTTVLITGESGTGKTLLARALHRASDRRNGPFVEVNCGALPENLLESELFGHVKGAFTGAVKDRAGKFEAASGGTIFLDEIGTASKGLQIRLLRVLQDRLLERVGEQKTREVDVRVVLATNLDLAEEVRAGNFREDLYYRIHVVALQMPALRERRGDVRLLADHFLGRAARSSGKPVEGLTEDAIRVLEEAPWPGNIRQLEHVIERAVVLCSRPQVGIEDLPPDLNHPALGSTEPAPGGMLPNDAHLLPLREALEEPERLLIERALRHFDGNRTRTAESLGINRSTLFHKMRKLGID